MTREDQAGSLGRWLERTPGSPPPDDVDSDVIEALYALRPDLAPAPRLTADDILASVTRGPLADRSRSGASADPRAPAEVVQFPTRTSTATTAKDRRATDDANEPVDASDAPVRGGRRNVLWMWVGGTGGLGMAMVAAATILLVATPVLRDASERAEVSGAASPAQTAPAGATSTADDRPIALDELGAAPAVPAAAPPAAPLASRTAPSDGARVGEVATRDVIEMEGGALFREPSVIPEATERIALEEDAVAVADEADTPSAGQSAPAAEPLAPNAGPSAADGYAYEDEDKASTAKVQQTENLDELRGRAVRKAPDGTSWRKGVDADVLSRIDAGIDAAEALRARGDVSAAADALAAVIQPPGRAGQYVALLAARDYRAAGDLRAAAGVALRGLSLSSADSPERTALAVEHGDALRAMGDDAAAAEAYRNAR
jgi:hypothetical protein